MSLLLEKEKQKDKEENGNSISKIEKDIKEEKEDESNLTNIKVFNGLIEEENNIFKKLNQNNKNLNQNTKSNKNNKNDLDVYFNDNKMVDLNYISFGDCDNLFVNNINSKRNIEDKSNKSESKNKIKKDKKDKSSSHSKNKNKKSKHSSSKKHYNNNKNNNNIKNNKINKQYVEEILTNDSNKRTKTMSFNDPSDNNIINKNNTYKEIIEKKEKESKNYFKIAAIKNGIALLVTGDDTVFTFPAYLLPKGAKLGESFILEIKLFNNNYNKKVMEEIEKIQKKYI